MITFNSEDFFTEDGNAPELVKPAAHLMDDLDALTFLLDGPVPKRVSVRWKTTGCIHYGIGVFQVMIMVLQSISDEICTFVMDNGQRIKENNRQPTES